MNILVKAKEGDSNAQCELGYKYIIGEGVTQSNEEAFKWFKLSAVQGNKVAQYNLGQMYANHSATGREHWEEIKVAINAAQYSATMLDEFQFATSFNKKEATKWYAKSANQGFAQAQEELGWRYDEGIGATLDYQKAFEWFEKAAKQGAVESQKKIAFKYLMGQGVPKDIDLAIKWYMKAAEQGDTGSRDIINGMYYDSKIEFKIKMEIFLFYEKLARNNHSFAQYALALIFLSGGAVAPNHLEAVRWCKKAVENMHTEAIGLLPKIIDGMKIDNTELTDIHVPLGIRMLKELTPVRHDYLWVDRLIEWANANNFDADAFPRDRKKIINLEVLLLPDYAISALPPEIGHLHNLKALNLDDNNITKLPPEIGKLNNLEALGLLNNNLSKLPSEIGGLMNLKDLFLGGNNLSELPAEIGQLYRLETLGLEENILCKLPPELGKLYNLVQLFLHSNKLSELPPEIGNLRKLEVLYIVGNNLSKLPVEIGNLRKLQMLELNLNEIFFELPIEILDATSLCRVNSNEKQQHETTNEFLQRCGYKLSQ